MKHESRHLIFYLLSLALAFLVFSPAISGAPLSEYRQKISETKQGVDYLLYADAEETNQADNQRYEREMLKNIRARFPASETIEWQGASHAVENGWLLEKLKAFEAEADAARRWTILNEVSGRLGAMVEKLDELQAAARAASSKDEDKRKLAEILKRAEYQKPEPKQENALQRAWRSFWDWIDRMFPRPKMGESAPGTFQTFSYGLQIAIFAIVLGIIGFLLYRFAPLLRQRFAARGKEDKKARIVLGERLAADATSKNIFAEAERLAREGNLRAAIRKGYIALLCELSDRKVIGLARHKTNRDYLRDVRSRRELYQNMSGLTGSFERHWYGFGAPETKDWEDFRRQYEQTLNREQGTINN